MSGHESDGRTKSKANGGLYSQNADERLRIRIATKAEGSDIYGAGQITRELVNKEVFFVGERHVVLPENSTFLTDLVSNAVAWWRGAGAPPLRTAFDVADHPAWAPNLFLVRRLSPGHFEYRLAGEEAIRIVGANSRGWLFDQDAEDPAVASYANYLERVAMDRLPWRCTGQTEVESVFANPFETVDLPLIDDDNTVSMILGVAVRVEVDFEQDMMDP